jgi:hypothetical protein
MKLDIQKIYIDSRFRTANSKSESDFNVELPRSFNVPDGVVAHIDDIVIPVSWRTVDDRNNQCHVSFWTTGTSVNVRESTFTLDSSNYDGTTFATALQAKLTTAIAGFAAVAVFACHYDIPGNTLTVAVADPRDAAVKAAAPFSFFFRTDAEIALSGGANPRTINTTIRNTTHTTISEAAAYICYLDLFNTRNLYLTSSALCSYDTVSNFGMDTIIKKIPCTASYNRMIFQSSGSTLDGLDVSKRTLRFLDFKLVDSSFRPIELQGNHFSFSIVFVQKR